MRKKRKLIFCLTAVMLLQTIFASGISEDAPVIAETPVAAEHTEAPPAPPTKAPAAESTDIPEAAPAQTRVPEPSVEIPVRSTIRPSSGYSAKPTVEPSIKPTEEPAMEPTAEPAPEPSPTLPTPTMEGTAEPTAEPADATTPEPTLDPAETLPPADLEDQKPVDDATDTTDQMENVERDYSIGWKGVVPSNERGLPIPQLFQYDYDRTVLYYNGQPKSVATSGCGATSVSMVIAYLTGDTHQNPYSLFCKAVDAGRYHGDGLSHETLSWLAAAYGVKTKWISGGADAIAAALKAGKPVIAHMGAGIFTSKGHYIVLRGLTEDGKVLVNDPGSASRSGMAYPMQTILSQTRTTPAFMICSAGEESDEASQDPEPAATPEPTPEATVDPASDPESEATLEPAAEATIEPIEAMNDELRLDANGSGRVDICDAQMVYDVMMREQDQTSPDDFIRADINGDGVVDDQDILCILNYIRSNS